MGIQPLMFTYSIHPAVTSFCPVLNHLVIIMCRMNKRCLILDMLIAQPTLAIPCCPGAFVTKEQDGKLLEWAHTIKSGFPLFVAAMDESNVRLNDCHVYIPLSLVRQFKEEVVKIVALDKSIYVVGAKKHNEDQIVLQSGWDRFVTSQRIQQNDLLIFIIEGGTRLKVLVLDPSGSEKTFAMGNSSNAQENPPLPPTVTNLSSEDNEVADLSSDDEVLWEKTPRRQGGSRGRYKVVMQKLKRWLQRPALLLNQVMDTKLESRMKPV
uniref:TF-B3 domain-containing protein n=1 Tax=Aegilops tauschii subsp. strangulata TaxID=200361 RepID=A0A453R6K3_AEGTS